jgi:hypothetical protein
LPGKFVAGKISAPVKRKKKMEIIATGSRMGLFYSQESV